MAPQPVKSGLVRQRSVAPAQQIHRSFWKIERDQDLDCSRGFVACFDPCG